MNISQKGKLSSEKASEIIMALCELYNISIDKAITIFYESDTAMLIDEGVADLHCRSSKYLAQCIWDEFQESL